MRIRVFLVCAVLALFVIPGCSSSADSIVDVSENEGKEVTIEGTIDERTWFNALDTGAYQVTDDTGSIWVITKKEPPEEGEEVVVTGTVESAFSMGGEHYGIVIVEHE